MYNLFIYYLITSNNINLIIREEKWLTNRVSQNYLFNIKVNKAF